MAESFATPPCGSSPLEAPSSRRSQGTKVGHTNLFRRRITRLDRSRSSASTQRHLTSATEHERALTARELALRAVAAVGADRHRPELPTTRHHARVPPPASPPYRAAGAWRVVVTTSRHVPHSAAPQARRRTVRAAAGHEAARRQARRHDARPQSPHRPREDGRSVLRDGATSLELIQQQQVIVADQRGVIMRGRRGSRHWPPARRRTRTSGVSRHARRAPHVDGQADEAMLALVRLLARQAAREVFDQAVAESDRSVEEGRE